MRPKARTDGTRSPPPQRYASFHCARSLRPYKTPKRSRKAKGIETYPEYPTAPAPKTLDNSSDDVVLPSPDQPVMGPSYTVHDNITSNVTAIGENTVESIKEDGASDVDVEGATDNAMGPNVGFWLTPDQQVTGSSYTLAHDNIISNATAIDNHAVEAVEEDGTVDVGATDKAMGPNVGFWPKIRERAIRCFKRLDSLFTSIFHCA